MPAFKHFNVWDNEIVDLLDAIEAHKILGPQVLEFQEWLYEDGCTIYMENELRLLQADAKQSLETKQRFADMAPEAIIGFSYAALRIFAKSFCDYFKDEKNEEVNRFLRAAIDKFTFEVLDNHRPFYALRAKITSTFNVNDMVPAAENKSKSKSKSDKEDSTKSLVINSLVPKKKSASPITRFLVKQFELAKEEYKAKAPTDDIWSLISDIDQYIIFRKEYELFIYDATLTPRVVRSPQLTHKPMEELLRSSSVTTISSAPSPMMGTRRRKSPAPSPVENQRGLPVPPSMLSRLNNFSFFDKKERKDEAPKISFAPGRLNI